VAFGCVENVSCATDVDVSIVAVWLTCCTEGGGDVVNLLYALDGAVYGGGVSKVTNADMESRVGESSCVGVFANEGSDDNALRAEGTREVSAGESRSPRYEHNHVTISDPSVGQSPTYRPARKQWRTDAGSEMQT